jgi:DoxX-like family
MALTDAESGLLRYSLVFVWLATALVSAIEVDGQSAQLLAAAGVHDQALARLITLSGAGIDALLGVAMWLKPSRRIYLAALGTMVLMTLLASLLQPSWWLHPLGPLTKNLSLAAMLWVLAGQRR